MISTYFGVPGCGKTTILTSIAQKELRLKRRGRSAYDHILTNFYCQGCEMVDFQDLGHYFISHSLILIDEVSLYADSRDFKAFTKGLRDFFTLHRHVFCDIILFCQDYSKMDKVIRELTYDLWYVTKPVAPILRNFSISKRIYRNITINEYTSDLVLGYRFSKLMERLFSKVVRFTWRPKWYKYFDSFDPGTLTDRPKYTYTEWSLPDPSEVEEVFKVEF